jgi:hypothetical protein
MSQPPLDEFNHRAWALVEKSDRTADETEEMIQAAHAAAIHWRTVGTPLNTQRAENLLAIAYLKAGKPELALPHAERGLALSEQHGSTQTPFDRATTQAVAAKALNLVGNGGEALRLITLAIAEADNLSDDDRAAFDKLFGEG